jgi:hypothetical protein
VVKLPNPVKEFYEGRIENNLAFLRYLAGNVGEMNRIREASGGENWEFDELARHIIFLEAQTIEGLRKGIEDDRENLKKLG